MALTNKHDKFWIFRKLLIARKIINSTAAPVVLNNCCTTALDDSLFMIDYWNPTLTHHCHVYRTSRCPTFRLLPLWASQEGSRTPAFGRCTVEAVVVWYLVNETKSPAYYTLHDRQINGIFLDCENYFCFNEVLNRVLQCMDVVIHAWHKDRVTDNATILMYKAHAWLRYLSRGLYNVNSPMASWSSFEMTPGRNCSYLELMSRIAYRELRTQQFTRHYNTHTAKWE